MKGYGYCYVLKIYINFRDKIFRYVYICECVCVWNFNKFDIGILKLHGKSINVQFSSLIMNYLQYYVYYVYYNITFIGNKSGTMTIDTALDLLQAAAAEMEEESEV